MVYRDYQFHVTCHYQSPSNLSFCHCIIVINLSFGCQEVKKEENIVRNNRGARKFESFGGRQQQQQQLFRNNFQERASDKEQWNRIYDTFNNWNDDAEHDNDDWNNQFDRDDNNNDLDAYHHDWDDNVQNDEHFANFQFEIKKLSESYSGSEASSNHPSYNSDDARNQNHRHQEDTVPQDNYKTIEQQRPQTFDNQGFQWSKAGIDQPQSPVFYADDTIKDAPPVYNTNSASIRMHRKPTSYPKSRSKARLQSYQVKDDIQEPVQKIVLPAPTKFQDYNRRISSQFQDKFYNDENVADFEFHDAADGYKNSFDYQRNPIREEFVQNDGWGSSSSDSSSGFADSEQKYPYPYQRPVFEVPDLEFDIQPIRIKEKEPSYQPETVSKSEYYYKPPSKPVERQTTKSRNPNSYIYLDEATKILSEPQPSKSYLDKYKPKQEPSEDIPASIDDLKNRPRGNRRVEDNVFRQEDSSRGYNRIPDYTKKQRGYRRIEDSANEGYRSEDNRVIGGYRLLDDSANEGYRRVDDSTSGGYRRVDENSNGGYRRVEDSASGESYQHGVSDHHGGIEAAVVAGANHFSPEHYEQPQRLAFQVHGQEGPQSYRFGHDTGVG